MSSWIENPVRRFKYKFSEPYRIRVGVGLSPLRNKREYNALIKFCEEELKDKSHMKLNPERRELFKLTLKLHKQALSDKKSVYTKIHKLQMPTDKIPRSYNDVHTLIEDNMGWYWN